MVLSGIFTVNIPLFFFFFSIGVTTAEVLSQKYLGELDQDITEDGALSSCVHTRIWRQ